MTEVYSEIVGSATPPWPRPYNEAITHACPNCGAQPFELCTGPSGETRLRMPCVARI